MIRGILRQWVTAVLMFLGMAACCHAAETDSAAKATTGGDGHLNAAELAIWNDPAFQQQFIQSYMAETEIEPHITIDEREDIEEVLKLTSANKMGEAAHKLEKARNKASSPVLDYMLANIFFQQERWDEAAELYQAAVNKFPKFRRAWKNLGIIYFRQAKYTEASSAMTHVIELGGHDAITYGLLGMAYSSNGQHLSAESAFRMAILLDSKTIDWKMGLTRSFFKQERYPEALSLCSQLIKDYPNNADLWMIQANAYIGMNQPLKAAEVYLLVDQLGKSTYESLNMLGDIYVNEKLYDLATDAYMRAMAKKPENNADRAIQAAKVLSARGALKETDQLLAHISQVSNNQLDDAQRKEILKLRARLAVAEGAGEEEARLLKEIVELDPFDGEALILLGQHSARHDRIDEAINYFQQAGNIEKYEADAKIQHAKLLVQTKKFADALPLLKRAQTLNPRDNVQKYLEQVERLAKTRQ